MQAMDVDGRENVANRRFGDNKPRMEFNFVSGDSNFELELPSYCVKEFLKNLERYNARSLSLVFQYESYSLLPLDRLAFIFGVDQDVRVQERARELCLLLYWRNWPPGSRDHDLIARGEIGEASPYFLGKNYPVVCSLAPNAVARLRSICAHGSRPG